MIFETSRQARFMIPMAISLGYGILFSTAITLLLVPSLCLIREDIGRLLSWRFYSSRREAPEERKSMAPVSSRRDGRALKTGAAIKSEPEAVGSAVRTGHSFSSESAATCRSTPINSPGV